MIPETRRPPGEGNGNPLQYSCLGNPMDRGAWWAMVHRVAIDTTEVTQHTCTPIPYFSATRGVANTPVPAHRLLPVHDEIQTKCLDRELCSMLCGSLVGRGIWRRMDT